MFAFTFTAYVKEMNIRISYLLIFRKTKSNYI